MDKISSFFLTFFLAIVISNAAIPPHILKYYKDTNEKCKETSQVDDAVLAQAKNGTYLVDNVPLGKHFLCLGLAYKTVVKYESDVRKEDYKLNLKGLYEYFVHQPHIGQELILKTANKCNEEVDDNVYVKVNKLARCLIPTLKNEHW